MSYFGQPETAEEWSNGACDLLAVALHRVTALPIYALVEIAETDGARTPLHAFCLVDSETMIDAGGLAPVMTPEEAEGTFYAGEKSNFAVVPVNQEDLEAMRNHDCDYEWEIENSGVHEFLAEAVLPSLSEARCVAEEPGPSPF